MANTKKDTPADILGHVKIPDERCMFDFSGANLVPVRFDPIHDWQGQGMIRPQEMVVHQLPVLRIAVIAINEVFERMFKDVNLRCGNVEFIRIQEPEQTYGRQFHGVIDLDKGRGYGTDLYADVLRAISYALRTTLR